MSVNIFLFIFKEAGIIYRQVLTKIRPTRECHEQKVDRDYTLLCNLNFQGCVRYLENDKSTIEIE